MDNIQSSKLAHELEPLQTRIEELKGIHRTLGEKLRQVNNDLETFEVDRPRYDALQQICTALDTLDEKNAKELFWNELPEVSNPDATLERLRQLSGTFQEKFDAKIEYKLALQDKIKRCRSELVHLDDEVYAAHLREQKRRDEFVIEREINFFPMHAAVMPWSKETESERFFRRSILIALLFCFLLGGLVPLINIPLPERAKVNIDIPERIAKLVREVPVVEEPPPPKPQEEEKKIDEDKPKKEEPKPKDKPKTEQTARKKIQNTGVLAFKETFKDLIVDTPTRQARIRNTAPAAAGSRSARRSLVAMQATGTSGGIDATAVSRGIGYGEEGRIAKRISAVTFSRVESSVGTSSGKQGSPLRSGPGSARTDEEIQIVFDRYKATLYRIYNKELRKNPTLRGNILLRISIEPGGEVSACTVESTDLASPELVRKIVARVVNFNFGPKKEAQKVTILYPIDFLPAR